MKRALEESLKAWKTSPGRQPLLLRGARQTGKTHLVKSFGEAEFEQVLTINFEKEQRYITCFDTLNVKEIIQSLEVIASQTLEPGKSLLFLDEIQACPNAIEALRYFFEDMPDLHVIGAGSLLEFTLSDENFSMPVGRVQFLYLYPMTFSEVLLALNKKQLYDYLSQVTLETIIPTPIHEELLKLLRLYFALGGMPRIVSLYTKTDSLLLARRAQTDLLTSYQDDFRKYATSVQTRYCERVYAKSLELVAKHVKYSDIDPDMDYRGLKAAVQLLIKAGIISPVYLTKANGLPLSSTQIEKHFKILFLDLGLAQAAGGAPIESLLNHDLMQLNRGALTEQFAGQHLLTLEEDYKRSNLYYWKRDKKNSSAEIDYVVQVDASLIPIEVKSGASNRLKSLQSYMLEKNPSVGIKLSLEPYHVQTPIWSIPLYLIEQLPRLIKLKES
jgi:uncharacterized protein